MWIQVRSMDGKKVVRIDGLSKLTKIEHLREKLIEHFDASVDRQRLFCRGKQMVDGHTLFDYNVSLNEVVLILVKPKVENEDVATTEKESTTIKESPKNSKDSNLNLSENQEVSEAQQTYKIGDIVDIQDETMGAWFEGDIIKVLPGDKETKSSNDGFLYHVKMEGEDVDPIIVTDNLLRPRAYRKVALSDINVGDKVMLNYNYDEPAKRGYWYDAEITGKKSSRACKELTATVFIGKDLVPFKDCKICFVDELFTIEVAGSQRNINKNENSDVDSIPIRETKPDCDHCLDNPKKKCKHCSCCICGNKKEPEKQLICDECNSAYHIYCLSPPLTTIPEDDEWFCPDCKLDTSKVVLAGEKLKKSSKKMKMASSQSTSNRDWGKGMACVGRSKMCTIVPSNHFGPVPGVEVGSLWKFRVQASESGIHRPHVAGIHGRENEGAYSIVLSGGYEDDVDDGIEFTYTGSGGRDLSGNKRTAEQSCDQTLTRMNRALAKNCDAPINAKEGAEAKNWKAGKPVRVVRNCKGRKHSEYSPEEGNRYDGIYKVVKYWPEKGKSGFVVWKYLLRRDDPMPAPWTKEGIERSQQLGLVMQYPDGWEETKKDSETNGGTTKRKAEDDNDSDEGSSKKKKAKKVKLVPDDNDSGKENDVKVLSYEPDEPTMKLIKEDVINEKLWEDALSVTENGKKAFLEKVENLFLCICCQDLIFQPVTTDCAHNFCKSCLNRSFEAGVKNCPACRQNLSEKLITNQRLRDVLVQLFPGYEAGR